MPKSSNLCLIKAAQGEFDEWHDMYPSFAETARQEGFEELAVQFERVAKIERSHENRFLMLMVELSKMNKAAAPVKEAQPKESKPAPKQEKKAPKQEKAPAEKAEAQPKAEGEVKKANHRRR